MDNLSVPQDSHILFDLSEKNLARITEYKIPTLENTPIEIYPYYHGLNLANIPASICRWFQIPALQRTCLDIPDLPIPLNKIKNIILLVIDGLPFEQMQLWLEKGLQKSLFHSNWRWIQEMGMFSPLTSVVPSTTANALTSLWTGNLPAEHGVVGYELFLKEYGITLNMILQSQIYPVLKDDSEMPHLDLHNFLPVPTLGSHFQKQGIQPFAFQHESICDSGLSRLLFPDVQKIPFSSPQEMWQKVNDLLDNQDSLRKFVYLYWGDIDTFSHHQGPNSHKTRHAWHWFSHLLENFISDRTNQASNDTLLLVTSDHGQIPTQIRPVYDVHNDREFMSYLKIPPNGESRFPYLFTRPETSQAFQEYVQQRWHDTFTLMPSAEILASGLFGKKEMSPIIQNRLGNYITFPKENAYWWWANKENRLLGRHGGFSAQEMITPFFVLPL